MLALDSSGSMKKKEADVIASAQDFVSRAAGEGPARAADVRRQGRCSRTICRATATSAATAIGEYKAIGGTALYDAMTDALLRVKSAEGRAWSS